MNDSSHNPNSIIDELEFLRKQKLSVSSELIDDVDKTLTFEHLISGISAKFSSIDNYQISKEIEYGLKLLVKFLDLDRSTLFEISLDKKEFISKYSFAKNGIKPIKTKIGSKLFPWSFSKVKRGEIISFASHSDLPIEAKIDIRNFARMDLVAGYLVPIFIKDEVTFALAGGLKKEKAKKWPKNLFPSIQLLGEIFANTIIRIRLENDLRESIKMCNNYKKEIEFENFFLLKNQKSKEHFNKILPHKKIDRSTLWITKGIEYYSQQGELKLNDISKMVGLSKTSFYNIYPNNEDVPGFLRYKSDILEFINYKFESIFKELNDLINEFSNKKLIWFFAELCFQNHLYFKCLALMVIEKQDLELKAFSKNIQVEFEEVVLNFVKNISLAKNTTTNRNALINTIYHQILISSASSWKESIINMSLKL